MVLPEPLIWCNHPFSTSLAECAKPHYATLINLCAGCGDIMRIGIVGGAGRMGRANIKEVLAHDDVELAGATEIAGHPSLGSDLGDLIGGDPLNIFLSEDVAELASSSDVLIEFSTPDASLAHAKLSAEAGCGHVFGTTGFDEAHKAGLAAAAKHIPIVWAPNMSQGVNLLLALTEQVARALDTDFDIEIVEMHHRHKVDAPSGTALALGEAAAAGRDIDLADAAVRGRDGMTGVRSRGTIGFAALRGGDVIGDHSVVFAADGERLELTHKASSREIYARGALRAARWVNARAPGLYGMRDVLGLNP